MLSATDADLTPSTDMDLFRIKIRDQLNGDAVAYDNKVGESDDSYDGTPIGGGNANVHKAKGEKLEARAGSDGPALSVEGLARSVGLPHPDQIRNGAGEPRDCDSRSPR